jgi:hypothetical protein
MRAFNEGLICPATQTINPHTNTAINNKNAVKRNMLM